MTKEAKWLREVRSAAEAKNTAEARLKELASGMREVSLSGVFGICSDGSPDRGDENATPPGFEIHIDAWGLRLDNLESEIHMESLPDVVRWLVSLFPEIEADIRGNERREVCDRLRDRLMLTDLSDCTQQDIVLHTANAPIEVD